MTPSVRAEPGPYLVSGATGKVGGLVAERLLATGLRVRVLCRSPERLPRRLQDRAVEAVRGDLTRAGDLARALEGVAGVFLMAVPGGAAAVREAVGRFAVRRVVLLSSGSVRDGSGPQPHPIATLHREAEDAVRDACSGWTILRAREFASNALWWAPQIRLRGRVEGAYPRASRAPVHEVDVADVAAYALTRPGHAGRVYRLTGPAAMSQAEQVHVIGEVLGRPLRYVEVPRASARAALAERVPGWLVDTLLDEQARSAGRPAEVSPAVRDVLGRDPRTFRTWVVDHRVAFSG